MKVIEVITRPIAVLLCASVVFMVTACGGGDGTDQRAQSADATCDSDEVSSALEVSSHVDTNESGRDVALMIRCSNERAERMVAAHAADDARKQAMAAAPVVVTKTVRFIYIVPKDRQFQPAAVAGIERAARGVQAWWSKNFDGQTFGFNSPFVEVVYGDQTSDWYKNTPPAGRASLPYWYTLENAVLEIDRKFGSNGMISPNHKWVIYIDAEGNGGAQGNRTVLPRHDLEGVQTNNDARWHGGLAHEMGHTFGLPDAAQLDDTVMSADFYNYPATTFSDSHKTIMRSQNSGFFSGGASTTTPTPSSSGSMRIQHSGKCMDVFNASTADGANIIQWGCGGQRNQSFDVVQGNGGFMLRAKHSGKCLDVAFASTADGANVLQWACSGNRNQILNWNGSRLQFKHSGKCLDVRGGSASDGARLVQWSCHSGANQMFSRTN